MQLVHLALLVQLVLSGASRISTQRKINAESADPDFCRDIKDFNNCAGIYKKRCPASCAAGRFIAVEDSGDKEEVRTTDSPQLEIVRVTKKTRPQELQRVMKTSVYKNMWPDDCNGNNAKGIPVKGLDIDGFACESGNHGLVPSIVHPLWNLRQKTAICCGGECVDPMRCPEITPKRFYEAAYAVATADSLKITDMQTRSGATVEVNIRPAAPEITIQTGVLATVEVRMMQADLEFERARSRLTQQGELFIQELDEPLGALITMQMMVWPDREAKVLFCAHGSTTATTLNIHPKLVNLPQDRADTIRDHLKKAMENINEDIAVLGEAHGHFTEEVQGFDGGREAHIIYKIYDGNFEYPPGCQKEDLYEFKVVETSL